MKKQYIFLFVFLILISLSCNYKNPTSSPKDTTPPYVVSIYGFAPGMAPNSEVNIKFSENISPENIAITLKNIDGDTSTIISDYRLDGDSIRFTPKGMTQATTYELEIYVKDKAGNSIDGNKDGVGGDSYKVIAQTVTPGLEIIRYKPEELTLTKEILSDTTQFKLITSADSVTYFWNVDNVAQEGANDSTLSLVFSNTGEHTIDVIVTDKYDNQVGQTWNLTLVNTPAEFTINPEKTTYTVGDTIFYEVSAFDPTIIDKLEFDLDGDGTIEKVISNINATEYSGRVFFKTNKIGTILGLGYASDIAGQTKSFEITQINVNSYFSSDVTHHPTFEDKEWEYDFGADINANRSGIHYEISSSDTEFVEITGVNGTKISGINKANYNSTMIDEKGNVVVYVKAFDEDNELVDELWVNIGKNIKPQSDIGGTVYSVSSRSSESVIPLEGALVVLLGDSLTTGPDGTYHFQNDPGDVATSLYIFAPGHLEREELIGLHKDNERDQYIATDDVPEGYIFETRMQHGNFPLRSPITNNQGVFLINPPSGLWQPYIEKIISEDMPTGSGGDISGYLTADSAAAFGKVKWLDFQSGTPPGSVYIEHDAEDPTKITGYTIYLGTWLDGSDPHMRGVTLKEFLTALYGGGDTMLEQYKGLALHIPKDFPIQEVPQGDVSAGVFLNKIAKQNVPGGYWGNFSDLTGSGQNDVRRIIRNNYSP